MTPQPDILADVPAHASFVFANLRHRADPAAALRELAALPLDGLIVGLGPALLAAYGTQIPGLGPMPALVGSGVAIPNTATDLFLRITGSDPGEVLHRERLALSELPAFEVEDWVAGFQHKDSRDLTGYEDGTENPRGEDAVRVAFQTDGSAVVAVQRWVHDLQAFDALEHKGQDQAIGRNRESNEELSEAPESAHVKRTAQESFEPTAFLLRRSMPWRDARGAGLIFVSFAATLAPFEAQLRRMVGLDDGVVDALFRFTRPVSGGTWWCPPLLEGRLDLRRAAGQLSPTDP